MKILHVLVTLDKGGAENHVAEIAKRQLDAGHEVVLSFLKGRGSLRSQMEAIGIKVVDLQMKFYGDPLALLRLNSLIKHFRPDISHAHLPGAEVYLALHRCLIPDSGMRYVASRHNDFPFGNSAFFWHLEKWTSGRFEKIICISQAVKRQFTAQRNTVSAAKTSVIYYGIDTAPYFSVSPTELKIIRESWGADDNTIVFLCIARLVEQKRIDVLLRAFASAVENSESALRLVIAGAGPLLPELERLVQTLGITDKVQWLGFRQDIPAILRATDVFVLCSAYEGLGLVLLEAAAAGRPVVASDASAIPEIVIHQKTGLLAKIDNDNAFASAMTQMTDRSLRMKLGVNALNRVSSEFTQERCFEEVMRIYSSVGAKARS